MVAMTGEGIFSRFRAILAARRRPRWHVRRLQAAGDEPGRGSATEDDLSRIIRSKTSVSLLTLTIRWDIFRIIVEVRCRGECDSEPEGERERVRSVDVLFKIRSHLYIVELVSQHGAAAVTATSSQESDAQSRARPPASIVPLAIRCWGRQC